MYDVTLNNRSIKTMSHRWFDFYRLRSCIPLSYKLRKVRNSKECPRWECLFNSSASWLGILHPPMHCVKLFIYDAVVAICMPECCNHPSSLIYESKCLCPFGGINWEVGSVTSNKRGASLLSWKNILFSSQNSQKEYSSTRHMSLR